MKKAGPLLFVVVVALVVIGITVSRRGQPGGDPGVPGSGDAITVAGDVGGEKMEFLKDPDVVRTLARKHHVAVSPTQRGSVEMVADTTEGRDFIWPASEVAVYRGRKVGVRNIFNSPIVIYSWKPVADALIARGIVRLESGTYYIVDLPKLAGLLQRDAQWSAIGLGDLYGSVRVIPTDPARSNSGLMFAGLYANILNNGRVVTPETLGPILKKVKAFYDRLGLLEASSGTLFEKYLGQGIGQYPMIVGYENQLVEFAIANPALVDPQAAQMRVLYPRPTVWASHPFIAVTDGGKRLMDALADPEIQKIAWERHGFRGVQGAAGTTQAAKGIVGIPREIRSVIPIPVPDVMRRLSTITRPM